MVTEAPSLYPEIIESQAPPGKGHHGYFRRLRDGWIVTHIAHPAAISDMSFKGFTFLPQFGTWLMPGPGRGSDVKDRRGVPFNPTEEPWRLIFQHPDGASSFTVEQIIAYRWHIRPPYREAVFPQIEDTQIYDFFCPECDKGIFSSPEEQIAADLLRQHLTSKFDQVHSYRPEDLRALGQEINVDFFAERRVRRHPVRGDGATPDAPPEAPEMTQSTNVLRCKDCGFETTDRAERMRHGKECPAKQTATA